MTTELLATKVDNFSFFRIPPPEGFIDNALDFFIGTGYAFYNTFSFLYDIYFTTYNPECAPKRKFYCS